MSDALALSRIHFPVTTLGPGRRVGIWFQGCSIRCPGCISADTWDLRGRRVAIDDVLRFVALAAPAADGVTVSGGEPFDQPDALLALLRGMRPLLRADADVLVYSGHPRERLEPVLALVEGLVDALISDPFDLTVPQTLALRGSDNQRLHCLTPVGHSRFAGYERSRTAADATLDFMLDPDGTVWLAGIPARGDLERLRGLLAAEGARAGTTEHRPAVHREDRLGEGAES